MSEQRRRERERQRERQAQYGKYRRFRQERDRRHTCEPVYRGKGHAYAYCVHCGRALTQYSQRQHDIAQMVKQIVVANVPPVQSNSKEKCNEQTNLQNLCGAAQND
jgi:hypothetical protein